MDTLISLISGSLLQITQEKLQNRIPKRLNFIISIIVNLFSAIFVYILFNFETLDFSNIQNWYKIAINFGIQYSINQLVHHTTKDKGEGGEVVNNSK